MDANCTNHDENGRPSGEPNDDDLTSAASDNGEPHTINPDANNYHEDNTSRPEKRDEYKTRIVTSHDVDNEGHLHTK